MKRILLNLLSLSLLVLLIGQSSCRRMIDLEVPANSTTRERVTGALPFDATEYLKIPLIRAPLSGGRIGAEEKKIVLPDQYLFPTDIGMPPVGDQGKVLGSCVGWAVGYAARSYMRRRETGISFTDVNGKTDENAVLSPSFIWNSLNGGRNQGIWIHRAIDLVQNVGVCSRRDMPYVYDDSLPAPNAQQIRQAAAFKIKTWGRIEITKDVFELFLYHNNPIIIQIQTDVNFRTGKFDPDFVWRTFVPDPVTNPKEQGLHRIHAVVLTGYDKTKGAFKLQNSWGTGWGDRSDPGTIWLSYTMLSQVVEMAYVMDPGSKATSPPVVETNAFDNISGQQVRLNGTIKSAGDKAITKYGFLVGPDSTNLTSDNSGIATEVPTTQLRITTTPYSFSTTYTVPQNQTTYYRAYAASTFQSPFYYYGKVIRITGQPVPTDIPDEVEDSPTAVSTADPHLTTFDRGRYSFMGVGEFVAAKSTGDNFLVQVRQSPYPNSTQVSVNTGVAVQTGSDVVCVYAPNQLYVNRQAVPLTFTDYALANGGSLRYQRNRLTIKNANGDVVEVQLLGADLDYFITPAKNRKGKLSGILGNYDGNPQNDIAKADGQVLRNDYSALYPAFADSWRIKDTESLFFYDVGKNTNSYTDKAFPRSEVQLTAAQSADAERICRQAGVTDPAALQGCIVDVALTGNRGFADRAKENEVVSGAKTTLSVSNFAQYRNEFVLGSGGTINGNTAVLPSKGTIRWSDAYLNRDGYETEVVLAVNAPSPCFPLFDLEVVDLQNAGLQNFLRLSTNSGRTQVELVNSGVQPQFHPVNVFDGNRHRIKVNTYKIAAGVNTILQLEVRIDNYEPLLIRNLYATSSLAGYLYPTLKSETLNCTTGQTTIYGWSFRSR